MGKRAAAVTPEDRYKEWVSYVDAADKDIGRGWWNRQVFRGMYEMFRTNTALQATEGFESILSWLVTVYGHYAVMLVRRESDKQAGTLNLKNLLHDLEKHHDVLVSFAQGDPVPSVAEIASDRQELERGTAKVVDFAHRFVAHRTPPVPTPLTMADIDEGFRSVRAVLRKYYAVLKGSDLIALTPTAQFDWLAPFEIPWKVAGFSEPALEEERSLSEAERNAREQQRKELGFVPND